MTLETIAESRNEESRSYIQVLRDVVGRWGDAVTAASDDASCTSQEDDCNYAVFYMMLLR